MNKIHFVLLASGKDPIAITLIFLSVLVLIVFAFVIIFLIFKNSKHDSTLLKHMNTTIQACFDFEKGVVTTFYSNRTSSTRKFPIEGFLERIRAADQDRVRLWLEDIRNSVPDTPAFIRTSVPGSFSLSSIIRKSATPVNGLLELNSISPSKSKVSIIIHKLSFVPFDYTKWANNYNSIRRQLSYSLNGSDFPNALFFIKLSLTDRSEKVSVEEPVAYTLIVDSLSREIMRMTNTELFELDEDMILILQNSNNPNFDFESTGRAWLKKVNQIISASFWDLNIGASIGAISSSASKQVRTLLEEGKKLAISASDSEEAIAFHGEGTKYGSVDAIYRTAFNRALEQNGLAYSFQPILNPGTSRVFGYHTRIRPKTNTFSNITDLKSYASRHNLSYELFFEYVSCAIRECQNMDPRAQFTRLFIEIEPIEINDIIKALQHLVKPSHMNIIFVLAEEHISSSESESKTFLSKLLQIRQVGYELAVRLENDQFPDYYELYKRFDFFIAPDIRSELRSKDDSYAQVFYTKLLEKLMWFKKPIIAISVDGWARVELLVRLGIDYVSSDDISPYSNTVREIDRRRLMRLNRFAE